jgi:type II secretory ATPase GspE/PulE/Tfp pilus assembly ATPase PilB-like protein
MLARRGMILVSGITDSGLSSTLYSLLEELALQKLKVISVEAEVQCRVPGVNQLVTQDRTGASFSCTLQLALNHAPDVVMVSELPDRQTAEIACRAAMEGRLVLAGSHSPTAFGALCRLLDLGIAPNEVAAALAVISSQRLLRKNCISCARPQTLGFDMEKALRAHFGSLDGMEFKRGRGCEKCFQLGHRGRTAVWEMVEVNEDIRYLLSDRFPPSTIEEQFRKNGFRTLEEDALIKAGRGTIAPDEIGELRLGIAAALTDLAARLPVGPKEDLESLAAMDTSAWEIQPEEEVTSWDELASLVDTLN